MISSAVNKALPLRNRQISCHEPQAPTTRQKIKNTGLNPTFILNKFKGAHKYSTRSNQLQNGIPIHHSENKNATSRWLYENK